MLRWQQQQPQLDNAMAYQQLTGVAVQILTNAIREGVIVIWIHIVLDVWLVGIIIAATIFRHQQVIGPVVQIAARVWQTIWYFLNFELIQLISFNYSKIDSTSMTPLPTTIITPGLCNGVPTTDWSCCSSSNQCDSGGGDCDTDSHCVGSLICGNDNCKKDFPTTGSNWASSADCCEGTA